MIPRQHINSCFEHSYAKPYNLGLHKDCSKIISPCNFTLYPKKLELVNSVSKVISVTKPSAVCSSCGKILYPNQIYWLRGLDENLWHARRYISADSPVNIEKKIVSGIEAVSYCYECFTKLSKNQKFHLFDDFGDIPECVKSLKSYNEYRKLAIGSLFCSTFKPPGYTYLHNVGDIWFNKDPRVYRGMVGLLYEGQNKEIKTTCSDLRRVLLWFRKNNSLYKEFFSNFETILGHFEPTSSSSSFASLPNFTEDLKISEDGQLCVQELEKQEGLLFPAEKFVSPVIPVNIKNVQIGEEVLRETAEKVGQAQNLSYGDEHLEAKLFPHLFPYGKGSWYAKGGNALTIGKYHKMRLMHVDRRWANDRFYPFFTFDRNIKQRLFFSKSAMATNRNRVNPLQAQDLKEKDSYYKYGSLVPTTIPGSKSFWTKKWLDLVAIVSEKGPADLFFTLTANDSWPELKDILSQYENPASVLHPVEPTEYFFQRFSALKPILFGSSSVFGKVENFWYRVEAQNRGALHIHGMLWLQDEVPTDAVVAEMPRGDESSILPDMVKKYQIHSCRPNRCFRTSKGNASNSCKYGFPYSCRESDGYDEDGVRFEYRRSEKEDLNVVPYNPYLLLAWGGHVNVQKITRSGLERYLVKYISKVEPTFGLQIEYKNDVVKYLESRIIGAPEAVAVQLSHRIVDSNMQVIFIDTNFHDDRFRILKPASQLDENDDLDKDVFQPGRREYYFARPKVEPFLSMTMPDYLTSYNVLSSENSKIPKYAGDNVWIDQDLKPVVKRQKSLIPRYHFLTPLDGEKIYYQQLLLKVSFYSENELLSNDNVTKTYKEECYMRGLFQSQDEIDIAFNEMKIRRFDPNSISKMARKMMFEQLADKKTLNKKIAEMELGEAVPFNSEIDSEDIPVVELENDQVDEGMSSDVKKILSVSRCKILAERQDLDTRIALLNSDQRAVFDFVSENLDSQILAFVTGPGGTGKSFLLHTLMMKFETSALIVEVLATSGNAAILIGGQTIHSFLKIGIDLNCNMSYLDQTWHNVSSTQAIIIDEISMMSGELLQKIDEICRQTAQGNLKMKPFGGKHVILFGDLLQLPAVVKDCTTRQIYESVLFEKFNPFFLDQNCRQKNDTEFAEMLNRIREGAHTESDIMKLRSRVCGSGHKTDKCNDLLESNGAMAVCSKHVQRHEINEKIQNSTLSDQPLFHLHARDFDSSGLPLPFSDSEFLNTVKGSMPAHIEVRKNARVMITRNLDIQGGIVNGTCGILRSVHPKVLMIEHQVTHDLIPVTKVKQKIPLKGTNRFVYRLQFPIILSWACTVHRVQGTTLDNVLINLDTSFFAAGQAYVALSRVKTFESLHLMSFDPSSIMVNPKVVEIMQHARSNGRLKSIVADHKKDDSSKTVFNESTENPSVSVKHQQIVDVHMSEDAESSTSLKNTDGVSDIAGVVQTVATECRTIFNKYLPLNMFLLKDNFPKVVATVDKLSPTFSRIQSNIQSAKSVFDSSNHILDMTVMSKLHPAFRQHYLPVHTSPDGNCLWHMISIGISGVQDLTVCLRLLTVHVLVKEKDFFQKFNETGSATSTSTKLFSRCGSILLSDS